MTRGVLKCVMIDNLKWLTISPGGPDGEEDNTSMLQKD